MAESAAPGQRWLDPAFDPWNSR